MTQTVLALDIDLGRIHAYSTAVGRVCYNSPTLPLDIIALHDVVIAECWGPQLYMDTARKGAKGELTNRLRAMLWNSFVIGQLAVARPDALVAPSSVWTQSFPEDVRAEMAGCKGQDNHDIRECRCMLFFYQRFPSQWIPLTTYMTNLVAGGHRARNTSKNARSGSSRGRQPSRGRNPDRSARA